MIRRFRKWRAWRWVRRDIANNMSYTEAAALMRSCARAGIGEQRLLLALAKRCVETAPPEMVPTSLRWVAVYKGGRRVRITTAPATFNTVNVPDDLRRQVDDVFDQGE
jgi:hypothetical protein